MRLSDMSLACLREADRVLCAVSGGADSMCLLHQLFTLSATLRYELIAIHFHHGLRAAADRDAQFVQAWCEARQIPFYCERGDAAACAAERGLGIEEAARKLRYDFLRAWHPGWRQTGWRRRITPMTIWKPF